MTDRPIYDALAKRWDELIDDMAVEMKHVLMTREDQRAFHMEMRDIWQQEGYEYLREGQRWTWRGMKIMRHEEMYPMRDWDAEGRKPMIALGAPGR